MVTNDFGFAARYGPWALVAGASDGIGALYARAVAERGMNVVLLARRQAVLDEVAEAIRADTGVETKTVAVDLATNDAASRVVDATSDLEIGMLMYNAGGDSNHSLFLDNPIDDAVAMVRRNCVVPLQLCHYFAHPMVERGKGAIVVISSRAGLAGALNMVTYGATKAFDLVMTEGLWAELHDKGIDVLSLVIGATDTPSLRQLLVKQGIISSPDERWSPPGLVSAADTVAEAIANLSNGPTVIVGERTRARAQQIASRTRSDAVKWLIETGGYFDKPAN